MVTAIRVVYNRLQEKEGALKQNLKPAVQTVSQVTQVISNRSVIDPIK